MNKAKTKKAREKIKFVKRLFFKGFRSELCFSNFGFCCKNLLLLAPSVLTPLKLFRKIYWKNIHLL